MLEKRSFQEGVIQMITNIKDNRIISLDDARRGLSKQKGVFVVEDMSDMSNITGYVAFVSNSTDTYHELIRVFNNYKKHQQAMIIGSYENGGAVGVQYEM